MIALGMMSGTSLDGIDAALVELRERDGGLACTLLAFETTQFSAQLEAQLHSVLPPAATTAQDVAELHVELGRAFAQSAVHFIAQRQVDFVATHGLTLFHDGPAGVTLQIGDPSALREALGVSVCFDFRSADCAAGGQGAPLVPYVDALLLRSRDEDRVAVNLGGIANLTLLPRGDGIEGVRAFDSGPGVMLVDGFVRDRTNGHERYDAQGRYACVGSVDDELLAQLRADPYFSLEPPKSTGRERFGGAFLALHSRALASLSLQDGAATLAALTATTLADAILAQGFERARILCSGGGVKHLGLMAALRKRLPAAIVESTAAMGLDPDAKEAIAFAVLGYETLRGRTANLPVVTGARGARILGAILPANLPTLLARIEADRC